MQKMPLKFDYRDLFRPTILLALAIMAVIIMMVLPVPAWLLDVGLALSFALAILMLTVTLFIERPLDLSAFPAILLTSLMLRLSLNVSSTKLIIGQGHSGTDAAGEVIEGFASFIMSGNVLLGVVVFCVLLIVNFMVITKGAGRMAEVGARFALDGLPGRQLAIDADMAAGAINHTEAKERREKELSETTFYGSLDGASKFVKGDAIAGLLITLLNIVMGLIMGVVVHGMDVSKAFNTYAILTVGDGLVSQIPAVVISVATALLLSRGGMKGAVDVSFFAQLSRYPGALGTVATLMVIFAVVPGMPFLPFVLGGGVLGWAAFYMYRKQKFAQNTPILEQEQEPAKQSLGDILDFDEIHLEFSSNLISMILDPAIGFDGRIKNIRNYIAITYGIILPEIRLTDEPTLPPDTYRIRIQGVDRVSSRLIPDHCLALLSDEVSAPPGVDVSEPVYGTPARWINMRDQEDAIISGLTVVSPSEVLATHLLETIRANLARLLSLRGLRRLMSEFTNVSDSTRAEGNRKLLDELVPDKVPVDLLLCVLRLLLDERVSIRNLPLILEAIAEGRNLVTPEAVCEHVRKRLGFQLVSELKRDDGTIALVQISQEWEKAMRDHQVEGEKGHYDIALPPDMFSKLASLMAEKINQAAMKGTAAAIVTSSVRRRFLKTVLTTKGINAPVLSYEEIGIDARPAIVGVVS